MKNTKKLFTTTCIFFVLFAMLTSCTTVPRNPQPLCAAAVSSTSDAYMEFVAETSTGSSDDIAKLNQILYSQKSTHDNYHPNDVSITIDNNEYTLQFSEVKRSRSDIDWEVDVYKLNQGDLHISVTFAHGDTKTPIGYKFVSEETHWMYDDPSSGIVHLSEDELLAKAREYAKPYVDLDVYNDYVIDYSDPNIAGGIYSGWYDIKFCTRILGIECVDYTTVRLYPDGRLVWVDAPPKTTVSKMFSKTGSLSGYEELEKQCAEGMRADIEEKQSDRTALGYSLAELSCSYRSLSLDEDGEPVLLSYYKLTYTTEATREVNGMQMSIGDMTYFITVGIWLG